MRVYRSAAAKHGAEDLSVLMGPDFCHAAAQKW